MNRFSCAATLFRATFGVMAAAGFSTRVACAQAGSTGVLIVAHGAGSEWNAAVDTAGSEVKTGGPVAVSFLMGPAAPTRRFQDAVAELTRRGAKRIVVVPLLVSSHSGHYDQVRYLTGQLDSVESVMREHLEMSGIERPTSSVPLALTPALDDAPELAHVVASLARALAPNPAGRALFIVGHGPNSPEDYAAWMQNLRRVADTVWAETGFSSVVVDLIRDDAPAAVRAEAILRIREIIRLQHEATGADVVVVPVLIASGEVTGKIPTDLAGLPINYDGKALLPHAEIARWVEREVREAAPATP